MTKKYRVKMYIKGGVSRPPYEGDVTVFADDDEDPGQKAREKLHRTSFPDVWYENMVVRGVEVMNGH